MKLAIMQPYFFPYIGYFQLIDGVNKFIYYDDVQFIKRGWIHRNRLLINGRAKYLTIPCKGGSKYQMINNVEHVMDQDKRSSLLNLVKAYYREAPYFEKIIPIVQKVLTIDSRKLVDISIGSIQECCKYLDMKVPEKCSSQITEKSSLKGVDRLIDICLMQDAETYINAPGGRKLYSKEQFKEHGINLKFLEPQGINYPQFGKPFVSRLSIIDVMMFNSKVKIQDFLSRYEHI